mmetsp:Transcript_59658/g.129193  ORF Transcript_59658/g.129193 Transcript_59658/m.129193 type:complete len:127 (+) Transcript_59658:64-444(+)
MAFQMLRASVALLLTLALVPGSAGLAVMPARIDGGASALKADMRAMMDDSDEDVADDSHESGLIQTSASGGADSYIQESADGLSAALGPSWNGPQLEENAKRSTKALLEGIRGHRSPLGAMLSALP